VLVSLIIRGVSFEFWGKVPSARWRGIWEWALAISSGAAALLFGVAWANFIHGVPMNAAHEVHASLLDLLHPYALLGGLTTLTLFAAHGANFLSLRLLGDVRRRADAVARRLTVIASVVMLGFLIWTVIDQSGAASVLSVAILAAIAAGLVPAAQRRSAAIGFTTTAVAILMLTVVLMVSLYPNALPSTSRAYDLTLTAASSSP
jgi:cytochrome bd ubiquinol oxidase subunit II